MVQIGRYALEYVMRSKELTATTTTIQRSSYGKKERIYMGKWRASSILNNLSLVFWYIFEEWKTMQHHSVKNAS